jgi:hypothetical protein
MYLCAILNNMKNTQHYICDIEFTKKAKTKFFTEVQLPICAGMQFAYTKGETKNNKIKKVGYKLVRIYYDSSLKDCCVGQEVVKQVFS